MNKHSCKYGFLLTRFLIAGLLFMVCMCGASAAEWRLHPSFDRTPVRIIDTPENTYFLVHQQIYNKAYGGYDFPSLTLFRYDKNAADRGITPLVHDVSLSSADMRLAAYSPAGHFVIVAYGDGTMDIVDADGRVTVIDDLEKSSAPGASVINSVTFDPETGNAWIATDAGYAVVDASTHSLSESVIMDTGLDRICGVGKYVFAHRGGDVWLCEGECPGDFSLFSKVTESGNVSAMIPLSETRFAYIEGTPGNDNRLVCCELTEGKWNAAELCRDSFHALDAGSAVTNRYESNILPNRDGYLLFSGSKVWQLRRDAGHGEMCVESALTEGMSSPVGSWDFESFWSYCDRGSFVCRKRVADASGGGVSWNDVTGPLRPKAPAAFIATYMDYSPGYGMIVTNHGYEPELWCNIPINPPLLSSLKGRDWTILSHAYHAPASVRDNGSLRNIYRSNINRFPLPDPNGLLVDPLDRRMIVCGSMFGGIMFQDLSDIDRDVIRFAADNDLFRDFPGFVAAMPTQTWGTLSCLSPPVCDSGNVIWSLFSNAFEAGGPHPRAQLKYITEESRRAIYSSAPENVASLKNWETIMLPVDNFPAWSCKVAAARHHGNENLIVVCMNNYDDNIIILDHKGTPGDISDDEYRIFSAIRDSAGQLSEFARINNIVEDPVTGLMLLSTIEKTLVFNPRSELADGYMPGETLRLEGGKAGDIIPDACHVNKIVFDTAGRMWIGTNNQGVVGVSADRKSVVARYRASDSPLPSDCVYGLGWNPDSGSLMVSTKLGLAEVFPDVSAVAASGSGSPSLSMTHVTPGYNGPVEIRNLSPGKDIVIRDNRGRTVRHLRNGSARCVVWNLKDESGERVPGGVYDISVSDAESLRLVVMSGYSRSIEK